MSKSKNTCKRPKTIPNKALYSRISFLYQAAVYLATTQQNNLKGTEPTVEEEKNNDIVINENDRSPITDVSNKTQTSPANMAGSRRLISDLRNVSLKAQIRMSPSLKHSICKTCSTLLIDGSNCTNEIENKSKYGRKSWADVLVRKCRICGTVKRYPLTAPRQKRRTLRLDVEPVSATEMGKTDKQDVTIS
ncbi:hypothetical protein GcC1_070013 [Golovinomyces cichoracearum]|uniref:Uncharacterized protein n=1 Tax=Golovinomyces cichoracearum TaxID=62708 RepID=A0A420IPT1_9PEZI|nr:hypothetical protein GcC1_070013 [Golovinomyces cichoracearum]